MNHVQIPKVSMWIWFSIWLYFLFYSSLIQPLALMVLCSCCLLCLLNSEPSKVPSYKHACRSEHTSKWFTYCQGFHLSNFCLPGSFNFICVNPLQTQNDACYKQWINLVLWWIWFYLAVTSMVDWLLESSGKFFFLTDCNWGDWKHSHRGIPWAGGDHAHAFHGAPGGAVQRCPEERTYCRFCVWLLSRLHLLRLCCRLCAGCLPHWTVGDGLWGCVLVSMRRPQQLAGLVLIWFIILLYLTHEKFPLQTSIFVKSPF